MGFVTAKKTHECVHSYDTNTCNNTEKKRGKMWMKLSKNESIIIRKEAIVTVELSEWQAVW